MDGLGLIPLLLLFLFSGVGMGGETDESDETGPGADAMPVDDDPQASVVPATSAPTTDGTPSMPTGDTPPADMFDVIFDDTRDADNGILPGTDRAELFIGSLTEGGVAGFNDDVTNPNDTITALGGNDTVIGGNGEDQIDGGDGDDSLSGGLDNDTVIGGLGADVLAGNEGSNVLTGGDGNDVFIIIDDEQDDEITDFSNEDGNRDFIDLTAHFDLVEEARAAYDPETGRMQITSEFIQFQPGITDNFTAETTGLADNQAPVASNDTVDVEVTPFDEEITVPLTVVTGQSEGTNEDTDVDGQTSDLMVTSVNGQMIAPGQTVQLGSTGSVELLNDGTALIFRADPEDVLTEDGQPVTFTYTVADAFGAASAPATVTLNFTLNLNNDAEQAAVF